MRDWSNIRPEPNMEGNSLKKLAPGTVVTVLEQQGYFVKVESDNTIGWVHKNRIKLK